MSQQFDSSIPANVIKQVFEDHGKNSSQWNDELRDLLSPSISARPLHLPESTRIKEIKQKEYHYHWAYDRCGSDPRHDRVERLRGAGWQYATTADVEMFSSDTIKQKNEIRIGDLRLMKLPLARWREIRKSQNLAALEQINPRRPNSGPMGLSNMTPGMTHYMGDDEAIRQSAQIGRVEVEDGVITGVTGNASVAHVK